MSHAVAERPCAHERRRHDQAGPGSQDLQRHYRIGRGLFKPAAVLKAVAGASFTLHRRPHPGGGGRIGLRQVHPRPHGDDDRAADRAAIS